MASSWLLLCAVVLDSGSWFQLCLVRESNERISNRHYARKSRPASRGARPPLGRRSHRLARRMRIDNTVGVAKVSQTLLEVAGREVTITNPDKVFFPQAGHTKLDLAKYYAAVADGALRGIAGRPIVLKRYVNGAEGEPFFQKRAPEQHPEWVETVELTFPSGRTAREIVVRAAAPPRG